MKREEALAKAQELKLDLVLVSLKARPPVAKITEAGKYFYQQQKKLKVSKGEGNIKIVKIKFNTSPHDLETKLKKVKKFLEKNHQVQIVMSLRGRENALKPQAKKKINDFVETIQAVIPVKAQDQSHAKSRQFKISLTRQ